MIERGRHHNHSGRVWNVYAYSTRRYLSIYWPR